MTFPVVILAGGLATRLRPITETIPKSLVDVAGRPFVQHQLEWLRRQGARYVVFSVGYRGEMIRDEVGDGSEWGLRIDYVFDGDRLLGTGGAVKRALPYLGSAFVIVYGDSYAICDLNAIEHAYQAAGRSGLMTVFRNDDRWDRSNVLFEDGRLLRYDKRDRTADMRHIDYGVGVLSARALESFPSDEPFDLATVYQRLLAEGDLAAYEVFDRFYEIGSPEGLEETRRFLDAQRGSAMP